MTDKAHWAVCRTFSSRVHRVRLLSKVDIDPASGCWNWMAAKFSKGYGAIKIDGRTRQAHRVSYELHCGPIPDGMLVCHSCDNPGCINPEHLFIGTNTENIADMVAKGRQAMGTDNGNAKLTEADVLAIRATTGISQTKLAAQYGVSIGQISYIRSGKSWAHPLAGGVGKNG